jgi:hypothetical protein
MADQSRYSIPKEERQANEKQRVEVECGHNVTVEQLVQGS